MSELVGELATDVGTIVRKELELAKVELSATATRLTTRLVTIGIALTVACAGFYAIVASLVLAAIALGLRPWIAALLVGGVLAIAGGAVAMSALNAIRRDELAPKESIRSLKETVEWAKQHLMQLGASSPR